MKQTIHIRRIETLKLELEVVQPLAAATLFELVNSTLQLGAPAMGKTLSHEITDFQILKAEPSCECSSGAKPKKRRS